VAGIRQRAAAAAGRPDAVATDLQLRGMEAGGGAAHLQSESAGGLAEQPGLRRRPAAQWGIFAAAAVTK
jgi:hypothetical protein